MLPLTGLPPSPLAAVDDAAPDNQPVGELAIVPIPVEANAAAGLLRGQAVAVVADKRARRMIMPEATVGASWAFTGLSSIMVCNPNDASTNYATADYDKIMVVST